MRRLGLANLVLVEIVGFGWVKGKMNSSSESVVVAEFLRFLEEIVRFLGQMRNSSSESGAWVEIAGFGVVRQSFGNVGRLGVAKEMSFEVRGV